ncbi:MAG TPA: cytochrome c [Candidatus Binataceae bacterium]
MRHLLVVLPVEVPAKTLGARASARPEGASLIRLLLAALAFALAFAPRALAEPPAELYTLNCWGCHLPHAEGIPGSVPRVAHSMGYFLYLPPGRAYLVQVPGVANSPLNDQQIADVLNWMLETFNKDELPKDFQPYTVEEIRKYRPHPIVKVKDARRDLAKQLAAMGYKVADAGP